MSSQFQAAAAEADTIFASFRTLFDVYTASFNSISSSLNDLPHTYQNQVKNQKKVLENVAGTVNSRQEEISNQLHAQGLVLLVGSAESLTREMFRLLLRGNIRKLSLKKTPALPLDEVLLADTDEKLGDLVLGILENDKNPSEKLNFQNMQSLHSIMKAYFNMSIRDDITKDLHKYWQIRHIIIHNAGIIDERFINNLKVAKLPFSDYVVGEQVEVTKKDYDNCFSFLVLLFDNFDEQIDKLKLNYRVT